MDHDPANRRPVKVHRVADYTNKAAEVFVLRFWRETTDEFAKSDRWRCRIRNENTGVERHVDGIENAFTAVRSLLLTTYENRA